MKKILIAFLPLLLLVSCRKNLSEINVDPKRPQNVPAATLFTTAEKNFTDLLTSSNVNTNIFRLIVQYWTETTYTDESNFDLNTRQIPRQIWNGLYRDVISNLRAAKANIPNERSSRVSGSGTEIGSGRFCCFWWRIQLTKEPFLRKEVLKTTNCIQLP